jgi:fumarylacetoacetate (FAA) hydrolase family protein
VTATQPPQPRPLRAFGLAVGGEAKVNNASCAIGPFMRLFEGAFGIDNVAREQSPAVDRRA